MSTERISLKELERTAFRSTFQDGLWDIYLGGVFSSFVTFAGTLESSESLTTWQRSFIYLAGMGISNLVFWLGKKFITLPRIGQVRFGPVRRRRARTLLAALGGIVGLQVVIVAFTIALWQIPALRSWIGFKSIPQSIETLIVAMIGALFIGPSISLVAYFNDFPRGYYIAAVMSIAVFCMIWFGSVWLMLAGGVMVILPGIYLFIRFLIQHPLQPREMQE